MAGRLISILFALLIIGSLTTGVIMYSRGFRIDFGNKSVNLTGIHSVSSYPDKASIWIDGKLTTATNASINLPPNWYQVKIAKEGYQSWEKRIRIQGEVVSQVDALLIPANPSLRALTVNGVLSPTLSRTGTRVAFIMPQDDQSATASQKPKTGVWIVDLRSPLLGGRSEPKQIFSAKQQFDWKNASILWSPDEKTVVVSFSQKVNLPKNSRAKQDSALVKALKISTDSPSEEVIDVTQTISAIFDAWKAESILAENLQVSTLPEPLADVLTQSATEIRFSPDENKILYMATSSATIPPLITPPLIGTNPSQETRTLSSGKYYVYDHKEGKNYLITDDKTIINPKTITWYSDSKHILMIEKDTISIIDYDGTNKRTVYAGPFFNEILYPWPSGGKIVILTNLNKQDSLPNLYEIDLR